jgi:tRNA modification GTPase
VPEILDHLTHPTPTRSWSVTGAAFRLTERLDLPVLVLRYDAPRSFTGEPVAELVIPGNPNLIERVLARLTSQPGVREAQPGEFSARAYLNGKLTLAQAEGVAATIAAHSERELAAAESLLSGRTGERYLGWADELATLLALVEAGIDFTDQEDVVPIPPAALLARVRALHAAIAAELGREAGAEHRTHTPRAVLVGPPNAGKSTLFNALLGRKRAVESPVAGTTRDALVEPLDLSKEAHGGAQASVLLIDLPGLDADAASPIDRDAQARAADEIARADILIQCNPANAKRPLSPLPTSNSLASSPPRPTIRVATKADLPHDPSQDPAAIGVCALDGWHLPVLRRAIADATWSRADESTPFLLPRHRRTLARVADHLAAAAAQIEPGAHALAFPETIADELRPGLDALAELTGDISPDDIIGRIFATFCVGK